MKPDEIAINSSSMNFIDNRRRVESVLDTKMENVAWALFHSIFLRSGHALLSTRPPIAFIPCVHRAIRLASGPICIIRVLRTCTSRGARFTRPYRADPGGRSEPEARIYSVRLRNLLNPMKRGIDRERITVLDPFSSLAFTAPSSSAFAIRLSRSLPLSTGYTYCQLPEPRSKW